jgi:ribonuclease VapC
MIVLDTSALITVLLEEDGWQPVADILRRDTNFLISSGTLAEARIVAFRRNVDRRLEDLLDRLTSLRVAVVDQDMTRRMAAAYSRYGKGYHAAGLNYGDCFAYILADDLDCPLLYVGRDFALTNVKRVL